MRDMNIERRKSIDRILDKYSSDLKYGEVVIKFEQGKITYIQFSETVKNVPPHKEMEFQEENG